MELDGNTEQTLYYIMNLNERKDQLSNGKLVKQEVPGSNVDLSVLLEHEVVTIKSEIIPMEDKCESQSLNTLEPEVVCNPPLELKSEIHNRDWDVETDANTFIKQEFSHEDLDIKSEDVTVQEMLLYDQYNLGNNVPNHKIPSEVKRFKCNNCDYSTQWNRDLKTHLRIVHTGEKPFKCNICDYCFGQPSSLRRHLKIHSGEKPFKCHICDYSCAQNRYLNEHLRTHTGEKPFKCNICNFRCGRNSNFRRHLRTHTGDKSLKCNICNYSCGQNDHLKRHLRTHTGEKPISCSICDYSCGEKSTLRRHLKTHSKSSLA